MAKETPTTVAERKPDGKVHNPREIVFPFDAHGFTTLVRKEGARAIGRIKGDKGKLDVFIQTLKVLGDHAKVKFEDQNKLFAQRSAAEKNRALAAEAQFIADKKAEVARRVRDAEAAKAELAVIMGETKDAE